MSGPSTALDEAFERLAASGFELPNGFVNHGPMACEALAALGCDDEVDLWARRFARSGGIPVEPEVPANFEWREALGDGRRLPEWIGYFERMIADDGWNPVVAEWVPLLLPGMAVALFHGSIRAAHAVRAIDLADTEPRRAELARALGYWAARFEPGQRADETVLADDLRLAVSEVAADGARRFVARPDILRLHGVTGAMAVDLFVDHIPVPDAAAGLAQVRAEHAALYRGTGPAAGHGPVGVPPDELVRSAAKSGDPHEVKLVEACLRGLALTGDPVFAAAAETVTGLGSTPAGS
ncbi:MAG TPA: hypothetical protein VMU76_04290 [Acidimicrobiales bacterium]|nr:hypothetical protein [Acidimicrobiales bacterium]